MKIADAVAQRVRELLIEREISQYRVEKTMAIPHGTMINIMNKRNNAANLKTIFQICKGLGVSVGEFFAAPIFTNDELDID